MAEKRSVKDYALIALKGSMMGAADAVPGVSGGTVAFITGIYEELIGSLKQFDQRAIKMLFKEGIAATWRHVNGHFLLALFSGILVSLFSIAKVVLYFLDNFPILLWSFFFGLILASSVALAKHIPKWSLSTLSALVVGTAVAYLVTILSPAYIEVTPLTVFLSGMIAICAMILPGISGSFILLLLGMYAHILAAAKDFDITTLGIFACGCLIGLLSFSHFLSWLFSHFKTITLALLGGFLFGSLNKVWPWKHTLEFITNRHGEQVPIVQDNVLPFSFETLTGHPAQLAPAIFMMIIGAAIVLMLERWGQKAG